MQDQRHALGQSEPGNFNQIIQYENKIPPSLIGKHSNFIVKIKDLYKYNLKIIKLYLNDAKIFIEQYYMPNQNDITFHNWFLYE